MNNKPSKTAHKLKEIINKAIEDMEITPDEYQEIIDYSSTNLILPKEDQSLLAQFHLMISNGTLKRVKK